jgi:zinc transporter
MASVLDQQPCNVQVRVREGRGEALPWEGAPVLGGADYTWIHLQRCHPRARAWLEEAGLDHLGQEVLLAHETRPRWQRAGADLLVVLRGVNLNPGAEPEDMVSLRMWMQPRRVVTLQGRPLLAVGDMLDLLADGRGPCDSGAFLAEMTRLILDRLGPVMDELGDEGDRLEEEVLDRPKPDLRRRVGQHRRQCIQLRRHLAPMREVVTALSLEAGPLLDEDRRSHLHEASDRLIRVVEDLDALRERAVVTHDELSAHLSDQISSTMFRLSLIAAVFLPLSLITSLLGINVSGIPGAGRPQAFLDVCLILLAIGLLESWVLYRRYWRRVRTGSGDGA